ncbi:hypothetical protein [Sagittula sp. MA-2]|jgi:hypothetical protein|uniref:hypothetical protein n=1 Tax=Sagittula sp. MA-2 TaxID=3048007 RepID=UPI0024C37E8D|nr:hypothetical protein [Sagittula sp. MA-2]WHZ33785.1 hypothetical protein QNI11_14165 [Sagittula sp. MA-2]
MKPLNPGFKRRATPKQLNTVQQEPVRTGKPQPRAPRDKAHLKHAQVSNPDLGPRDGEDHVLALDAQAAAAEASFWIKKNSGMLSSTMPVGITLAPTPAILPPGQRT